MKLFKLVTVVFVLLISSCDDAQWDLLTPKITDLLQGIHITYGEMHDNEPVIETNGSITTTTYTGIGVTLTETEDSSNNSVIKILSFDNCNIEGNVTGEVTIEINNDTKQMAINGDLSIDGSEIEQLIIDVQCDDCDSFEQIIDGEIIANDQIYAADQFDGCFDYY